MKTFMKKTFAVLVSIVMIFSCFGLSAYAEGTTEELTESTSDSIAPWGAIPDASLFYCPYCGGAVTIYKNWTEYNYYYTTMWYTVFCTNKACSHYNEYRNVSYQINNVTYKLSTQPKTAQ